MAQIQSISPDTSADEAMAILERDGAVIYERLLDGETIEMIQAELGGYLDRSHLGEGEFWASRPSGSAAWWRSRGLSPSELRPTR